MKRTQVYRRADGKWDWRSIASNGQITSTSAGQGFENKAECIASAIRENHPETPVEIEDDEDA